MPLPTAFHRWSAPLLSSGLALGIAACGAESSPADGTAIPDVTEATDNGETPRASGPDWTSPFVWTSSDVVSCPPELAADDALSSLAAQLDLPAEFGLDPTVLLEFGGRFADDPARLLVVDRVKSQPSELPCFAGNRALEADLAVISDHPLASLAAGRAAVLGISVPVGGGFPSGDENEPLMTELRYLNQGVTWDEEEAAAAVASVPLPVQRVVARILRAVPEAAGRRDEALDQWRPKVDKAALFGKLSRLGSAGDDLVGAVLDPKTEADQPFFENGTLATSLLYEGGTRLLQALDEAGRPQGPAYPAAKAASYWPPACH